MNRAPLFALEEVFEFLDPKSAFFSFPLVCASLRAVLDSPQLLSRYLCNYLALHHDYQPTLPTFARLLPKLMKPQSVPAPIPLTGLATTGGIDENQMHYWIQNMFTPNSSSAYCSRDHKNNIMCSAVLAPLIAKPEREEQKVAKRKVAALLRTNEQLQGMVQGLQPSNSTEELTAFETDVFLELYRQYPFILFPRDADSQINDERERFREFMRELAKTAEEVSGDAVAFKDVLRRPDDYLYLEKLIEKEEVDQMRTVFIAKEVKVSRKGDYTCPLETFLVFISEEYINVESEQFTPFDNLLTPADVRGLAAQGGPEVLSVSDSPDLAFIEFRRSSKARLHPVLWGKFKTRQGEEIETPLHQVFAGKYLYVKLINPENRMAEMHDMHEFTNIDVKFIGIQGVVEQLS